MNQMAKAGVIIVLLLAWSPLGRCQQTPVPIEEEPHHHVLFKNESVEVIRATLAPGESTLFHIHSHDRAGVELLTSTTTEQLFGKPEGQASMSSAGEVYAESCTECPMAHRVHNVGSGPMDVINVELLSIPAQPSKTAAGPVAAENPSARLYNWILQPGRATPMHTHVRPYVIVAATPMRLQMTGSKGALRSEQVKAADFHWVTAPTTHSLANDGPSAGQIVEIELK